MQVSLILALVVTALAGILSNPLFTLANNAVVRTPMLQKVIPTTALVSSNWVTPPQLPPSLQ
ncbi:MAG TPA: NAD(P)H-quinone oxidoreductase subunit 2, partial [Leptolyngbyaceae cyanobacterium M65_K2018_010]|nr:NAD(P)H-quinone oxidoreductase subunit 2 [Leptolyngbyaceae cyanobacterium M65_K2018_010]